MTHANVWKQNEELEWTYADVRTADMKFLGTELESEKLKSLSRVKNCPITRLTMASATPDAIAATKAIDSRR